MGTVGQPAPRRRVPAAHPWEAAPDAATVGHRLQVLRRRMAAAAAGGPAPRLVAVTKGFGPDAVMAAVANGLADVGENYPQELLAKAALLPAGTPVRWHHLGAVQRRHVRSVASLTQLWHGVCRVEEGTAIAEAAPGASVLVQLELTGDPTRRGVVPAELDRVVAGLCDVGVVPVGVMALGVAGDRARTRAVFDRAVAAAAAAGLPERSMGMSDDVEEAVAAGATIVRVGRALFGDRPPRIPPRPPAAEVS